MNTLHTVGHGTMAQDAFIDLLHNADLSGVIDIRSYPGSRHNPHFARERMERWLPEAHLSYTWMRDLGGRRKPMAESRHVALRHQSFRAYADYMDSTEFVTAVEELLTGTTTQTVMCSETLWWRCHRRLLADYVTLIHDAEVLHLMHDGRLVPHNLTEGVRRDRDRLTYDVPILQQPESPTDTASSNDLGH